jgi:hypothetical protein
MAQLILKRASVSRPSGEWNDDDYDVLCNGAVVGRIFNAAASPVSSPLDVDARIRPGMDRMNWIWTLLWLLLVAVVSIVGKSFWDEYSFQILTVIVFVTAGATIELWQRAARSPEKTKKKFRKRLWDSKPITPKHDYLRPNLCCVSQSGPPW